eukprot:TRINITY_DN15474_c0_g1_i1.p1 TRINITY_DN15474_c0_g1~~TRINITY_DN15474_c0_g1_i1.p1  ORF type:complete len:173 (-),score=42.04 TRINITY_DN15474_c0_g1_i1:24-542(-)
MQALTLLCFSLLFLSTFAQVTNNTESFSLFVRGSCKTVDDSATCRLKGNSQTMTTLVGNDDGIEFQAKEHFGSYAVVSLNVTDLSNGFVASGNITFGTHGSRDATLYFTVSQVTFVNGQQQLWSALAGNITGGLGEFLDHQGVISIGGAFNNTAAFGLVSGHVWKNVASTPQ